MFSWFKRKNDAISQIIYDFELTESPSPQTGVNETNFLVIDLELTGLNPKQDHIISFGWVPIRKREIILADARHYLINTPVSVGQSAVIHGLHDKDLKNSNELCDILTELLRLYAGYIFVAHHSILESSFLQMACQRCFGKAPKLIFIDTLKIEWQRMNKREALITQDTLRLTSCLERHKLPVSSQHHALEDAYSCAMLFLSQIQLSHNNELTLGDLLQLSK